MQQIPTTELERSLGYAEGHRRALERGRTEGRSEGRNEGRVEGRIEGRNEGRNEGRIEGLRALRALALDLLGSDRVAGLDAINDPDELRAEIRRRVAGAENASDRR
jgi:flagellar biosynthesis/type III secretory pathway protein FliH